MQRLRSITAAISSVSEVSQIGDILTESLVHFDMQFFFLGMGSPNSATTTRVLIEDNFPKLWRDYYDSNCLAKIDPTVNYCLNNHTPTIWSDLKQDCSSLELGVFEKAKEHGLVSGFSIPIHNGGDQFGMLSMACSSSKSSDELFRTQVMAQTLIPVIQDTFNRLTSIDKQ